MPAVTSLDPTSITVAALATGGAIASVLAVGVGPIGGFPTPPPEWALVLLLVTAIVNLVVAAVSLHQCWRPITGGLAVGLGAFNLAAVGIFGTHSHPGYDVVLADAFFFVGPAGVVLTVIGVWTVDLTALAARWRGVLAGTVAVGLVLLVADLLVPISLLVVFLWFVTVGLWLSPAIIVGWIRSARGAPADVILFRGVIAFGLLAILVLPTQGVDPRRVHANGLCLGMTFADSLDYAISISPLEIAWSDGCRRHVRRLEELNGLGLGLAAVVVGSLGETVRSRIVPKDR